MADETTSQPNIEPTATPTENPISESTSTPAGSQEPGDGASIPTTDSAPIEVPPVAPEASKNDADAVPVKDVNLANEPLNPVPEAEAPRPDIAIEKHGTDMTITEVMEPTAQMAGNEPIDLVEEEKVKRRKENLKLANKTRQEKRRKKIDEILDLFAKQTNLTNDEVEKLLHVSDATATRYLETLEKEGKIKQVDKTGKGVTYEKI